MHEEEEINSNTTVPSSAHDPLVPWARWPDFNYGLEDILRQLHRPEAYLEAKGHTKCDAAGVTPIAPHTV